MARPPKSPVITGPIDLSLFTDEELKQYQADAEKEYALESKKEAIEQFKEDAKEKLRKKSLFKAGKDAQGEDIIPIQINLAPHAPDITIDGMKYFQGVTYKFTPSQAQTINDIMAQTWRHEDEVRGVDASSEYGRRRQNKTISPNRAA